MSIFLRQEPEDHGCLGVKSLILTIAQARHTDSQRSSLKALEQAADADDPSKNRDQRFDPITSPCTSYSLLFTFHFRVGAASPPRTTGCVLGNNEQGDHVVRTDCFLLHEGAEEVGQSTVPRISCTRAWINWSFSADQGVSVLKDGSSVLSGLNCCRVNCRTGFMSRAA